MWCKIKILSLIIYILFLVFNHLSDPYPTDDEKKTLSEQTGLSVNQVNNWFGNKRMRYKRKMLEDSKKTISPSIPPSSSSLVDTNNSPNISSNINSSSMDDSGVESNDNDNSSGSGQIQILDQTNSIHHSTENTFQNWE